MKIPCIECGELILLTTAEKTGGLCIPCKNGTRASINESIRENQEKREYVKKLKLTRDPVDAMRLAGKKMKFKDYFDLDDPAYEIFLVTLDIVFDKRNTGKEDINRLSNEARLFYLLWGFDGEIHNGGFDQLFVNSTGDDTLEILQGLNVIGATTASDLLQQAISWFPNSLPSNDRKERWKQYEVFYEQDRYQSHINQLDSKYYKDGDELRSLLNSYVMLHGEAYLAA